MYESKEQIVCPAVRYLFSPKFQGRTIEIEKTRLCIKYDDQFATDFFQRLSNKHYFWTLKLYEEGFMTNKGRFVDPKEALEITGWGAQLRFKERKRLLPEDLYQ